MSKRKESYIQVCFDFSRSHADKHLQEDQKTTHSLILYGNRTQGFLLVLRWGSLCGQSWTLGGLQWYPHPTLLEQVCSTTPGLWHGFLSPELVLTVQWGTGVMRVQSAKTMGWVSDTLTSLNVAMTTQWWARWHVWTYPLVTASLSLPLWTLGKERPEGCDLEKHGGYSPWREQFWSSSCQARLTTRDVSRSQPQLYYYHWLYKDKNAGLLSRPEDVVGQQT